MKIMKKITAICFSSALTFLIACQPKSPQVQAPVIKKDSVITITINNGVQAPMNEEGLNTDYYNNGKEKMKGAIKEGQREGLWQAWYENGNLWSEAEYKKGLNHGKSITYFENGKVRYEGRYEDGKKVGVWKYYDEAGKLVKTINN